jgi:hypothetical protein
LKAKQLAEKVKKYQEELESLSKKDIEVMKLLSDLLHEINAEFQIKKSDEKSKIKLEKKLNSKIKLEKDVKVNLSDIFKKDFYLSELPEEISSISYK